MADSMKSLNKLVWTALMAAAISLGAYLVIPVGPVPISMQPLFVFLAGMVLGTRYGLAAVGLYILAGIAGLPVFSGGGAGIGHILGPTGGYLLGFAISPVMTGRIRDEDGSIRWLSGLFWGLMAMLCVYTIGAFWLKMSLDLSWEKTFAIGIIPFVAWDELKVIIAILVARHLKRLELLP